MFWLFVWFVFKLLIGRRRPRRQGWSMVNLRKEELRFVAGNGAVGSLGAARVPSLLSGTAESQTSHCQPHPDSLRWLGSHGLCRKHNIFISLGLRTLRLGISRTKENSRWKPHLNSEVILGGTMFRCLGFVCLAMTNSSSSDKNREI